MKVIKGAAKDCSRAAALKLARLLAVKPDAVVGFSAEIDSLGLYEEIAGLCGRGEASLSRCTVFVLGEYCGIDALDGRSCRSLLTRKLFSKTDLPDGSVHSPDPSDPESFSAEIAAAGGLDMAFVGIGTNGRLGFNEPLAAFDSRSRITKLTDYTRRERACVFGDFENTPERAVTAGVADIMGAKRVIVTATGESRAGAVKKLVQGRSVSAVPASYLQLHDDVILYAELAAAGELD